MLVSFTFENWRSFRDANTLNLVASAEKQHGERIPDVKDYDLRLLPIAAVYGGNASGKSNLFKALKFTQWMVTEGPTVHGRVPVEAFRLDKAYTDKSSRFSFVILVKDESGREQSYEYSFVVDCFKVLEEKLIWIKKRSEVVLFERQGEKSFDFHKTIIEDQNLHSVLESTRSNQLSLTNAAGQNTSKYKTKQILSVFKWFERLTLIDPKVIISPNMSYSTSKIGLLNSVIGKLGTGIERLSFVEEDISRFYPPSTVAEEFEKTPEGLSYQSEEGTRLVVVKENEELKLKRLVSVHQEKGTGNDNIFDLKDDSDGTRRTIDLLPSFLNASAAQSDSVIVIDELDRSLHTLLVRQLLESYLASCSPESRSQIIFTTHDVLQMDQNLLRRDEMWVTDRRDDGSTELIPLSSFKEIRKDKSIRTSYLRGQLGGTPKLLLSGAFHTTTVLEPIKEVQ